MEIDKKDEIFSNLYLKILNFLSYRKRSLKEINDRLDKYIRKFVLSSREKEGIRDKVIDTLKNDGYLKDSNDVDFADYYISNLEKSGKTFNKLRIYKFLISKGIPKDVIENALNNVESESVYKSVMIDAQKKLRSLKEEDKYLKKKKLLTFLYRKGYPYDVVSSVVDTLM